MELPIMGMKENLKRYRIANNLSQEQAAKAVGIARQSLSRWELGQAVPTEENLAALAKVYNASVDELRYDEQELDMQLVSAPEAPLMEKNKMTKRTWVLIVLAALLGIVIGIAVGWYTHMYVQAHTVYEEQVDLSEAHGALEMFPVEDN